MIKKIKYLSIIPALAIMGLVACEKETPTYEELTNATEGTQIYIAKAARGFESLTLYPYIEERTTNIGVNYGGLGLPANDINVEVFIDQEALDSVNTIRIAGGEVPYLIFPEGSYDLGETSFVIPKGTQSSNVADLVYYPNTFDPDNSYLLPISIKEVSGGYPINKTFKTVFFEAGKLEPKKANTTNWQILDYSSQEDRGGEGAVNGRASTILDGDIATFWHSCWYGCIPTLPHYITVNMLSELEVRGFYLSQRQSLTRNISLCEIQISSDNVNWESLGEFPLERITDEQDIALVTPRTFQYFKFIVKSVYDGTNNVALAELTPYTF